MRTLFFAFVALVVVFSGASALYYPNALFSLIVLAPICIVGLYDAFQDKKAILRNFPVLGHARYLFEKIRPEIHQYFVETDQAGRPINRETRSVIYQRSKNVLQTLPFGTRLDLYEEGYEWFNHSLSPVECDPHQLRITIGGKDCTQPYSASIFNISAMSYGSLSTAATLALNEGAKKGHFAHNTGEGGVSPYHLRPQGDLIWQVGTGYFGARDRKTGGFSPEMFAKNAAHESVKMIELKLSQGAKPGHGGILPAAKITPEIAEIRGVDMGKDVLSPPYHSAFSTPIEMCLFIQQLRELSNGKPVGFKLCVGKRREFLALCKAMIETEIYPDFIAVDGGEGGTGAAPVEFANSIGTPAVDGLVFVHNSLVGFGLRDEIKVLAAGRVFTASGLLKLCALGADATYSARGMMLALGCIQALMCNSNHCPVGVATQKPSLVAGLVPSDKAVRVHQFHENTVHAAAEMLGAMGIQHTDELRPWHLVRRLGAANIKHYGELFEFIEKGQLLGEEVPESFAKAMLAASSASFRHAQTLDTATP